MKRILLLTFIISGCCCSLRAQEVTYNNEAEKLLIKSAQTPDDYLKLALLSELSESEEDITYTKFKQDLKQLKLEPTTDKKSERRTKEIYQVVSDAFLKDYEYNANFSELFLGGRYNCTTASILYAYILETLHIPYQIKQFPGHVYVIAYPETYKIQFETVDPRKGFYVFDDQSKIKDVNSLVKQKYIELSYANKVGVERAFDDFFYSKEDISLKEAVGLLYFNKGMESMRDEKAAEAYADMAKSDILFPDKKNEFFENDLMSNLIIGLKYDDMKDWETLTRVVNDKNSPEDRKKFLQYQFVDLLNNKLLKSGQKDKVDQIYNYLYTNVNDTTIRSQIQQDYLYENANYAYITSNYTQALDYIEKDYTINPNNPLVISEFVQLIQQKISGQSLSLQTLNVIDKYMTKYPGLAKNPSLQSLYIYNISYLSSSAFITENGVTGEKYMNMLIKVLDTYPDHGDKYDTQIVNVFAKASEYYFRKQGRQKAIATLNVGLKYVPGNENLTRKLKVDSQ